ncbi:MAG: hypothetical protein KatS3mg028_0725 [Bacteroidia bacterium]|nr:MAG: hypothetical protein KatS3mg028_0725 [Bacteroidia bacterium]
MDKNDLKTNVGVWMNGLVKLKNAGFSAEDITSLNVEISELIGELLTYYDPRYYDQGNDSSYLIVKNSIEELWDGIISMKKAGFEMHDIYDVIDDIKDAYSLVSDAYKDDIYDDDDEYDDDDDDDEYDDDDNDDNNGFDVSKFFPKK